MSFWKKFLESDSTQNLRIIITRHGERTDFALGPGWTHEVANSRGRDSRISYLTPRKPFFEWEFDTPLTSYGERQSRSVGQRLWKLGYQIDYCYSSPAYRSIQTATNILKGQGRQAVPIKIEPGVLIFSCFLSKIRFLRSFRMSNLVRRKSNRFRSSSTFGNGSTF